MSGELATEILEVVEDSLDDVAYALNLVNGSLMRLDTTLRKLLEEDQ